MTSNSSRPTRNREHLEKQLFGDSDDMTQAETGVSSSFQPFPSTDIEPGDDYLKNLDISMESLKMTDNEFYAHSQLIKDSNKNESELRNYGLLNLSESPSDPFKLSPIPSLQPPRDHHVSPKHLDLSPPRMSAATGVNDAQFFPRESTVFDVQTWQLPLSQPQTSSYYQEPQSGNRPQQQQQQQKRYEQQRIPQQQQQVHGHYNQRQTQQPQPQPLSQKYSSDSFESAHSQVGGSVSPRSPRPLYSPPPQPREYEPPFPAHQQSPLMGHQQRIVGNHMLSQRPQHPTPQQYQQPQQQFQQQQYQQQQQVAGAAFQKNVYSRSSKRVIDPSKIEQTVYVVQFKVATKAFLLGYSAPANTAVGNHVLVSVEGGEDLGVVSQLVTMREYLRLKALQILPGTSKYKFDNCMGRILRLATADEKGSLIQKACDEQEVLEYCLELNQTVFQLPVLIAEAEYQFDRRALSVHYSGLMRPDMFCEFTQAVAKRFKTSNVVMVRIV